MYVCICRAVTENKSKPPSRAVRGHLRDLRSELGIIEDCGRCAAVPNSAWTKPSNSWAASSQPVGRSRPPSTSGTLSHANAEFIVPA